MQRNLDKAEQAERSEPAGLSIVPARPLPGTAVAEGDDAGNPERAQDDGVAPGPTLPCQIVPPPIPTTTRPSLPSLRLQPGTDAGPALRAAPVISQFARNAGTTRRVETIYFDTPGHRLSRAGMSLRIQTIGRRIVQTLSPGAGYRAGPEVPAWMSELREATPDLRDLDRLQADWLPQPVREALARGPLVPVFVARLRRLTRRLDLPDALIDVVFEDGTIEAQDRSEAVDRITLVSRDGDRSALHDIGLRLLDAAPLQVGAGSMIQRGYALATGTALRAQKAAPSSLTPAVTTDEAIAGVLDACRLHLQSNQAVAREGSAEGVHQMRVALRRLRSMLSLLRRDLPSAAMQSLGGEAKWAADQLGAARGWDVFLADTLGDAFIERVHPAEHVRPGERVRPGQAGPDFQALRKAIEAPRASAYRTVRALLASPRFNRFQLTLGHWIARRGWRNEVAADGLALLSDPAALPAAGMLARLHRKALRQGRQFRRLSANERHDLRITLKKLRYATEFFLPVFATPDHSHRFVRRLGRLQEALGLDHDAAETQPLLDELGRRNRAPGLHQAIGAVIGWQAREEVLNLETLAVQWRRFRALQPFWPRLTRPLRAEADQSDATQG